MLRCGAGVKVSDVDASDRLLLSGPRRSKKPLPPLDNWLEDLDLERYLPSKVYSEEDLSSVVRRVGRDAGKYYLPPKPKTKLDRQLDTCGQSADLWHITQTQAEMRRKRETVRNMKVLKSRISDEIIDYDPDLDKRVAEQLKYQAKFLKGKSAKAIEKQLLTESNRNIQTGSGMDLVKFDLSQGSTVDQVRKHNVSAHASLMCQRLEAEVDNSFMAPLESLNADLKSFDKKSTTYFMAKR
ncbi:paramyosin, short form-like [Atheta coriaria]|uniref:paramyosin, short form-like n=1 Tax=Dalotia coriaria TaxID=877792 RepID=UPI0031F43BB3